MPEKHSNVVRFALLVSVHSTDIKRPGNSNVVFFFFKSKQFKSFST